MCPRGCLLPRLMLTASEIAKIFGKRVRFWMLLRLVESRWDMASWWYTWSQNHCPKARYWCDFNLSYSLVLWSAFIRAKKWSMLEPPRCLLPGSMRQTFGFCGRPPWDTQTVLLASRYWQLFLVVINNSTICASEAAFPMIHGKANLILVILSWQWSYLETTWKG